MSRQRTVLVVDDDSDQLAILAAVLEHEDFEVVAAQSAREGLKVLESQSVDVVVTDLAMPDMNGLDFVKCAREIGGAEKIPMVLVSAGVEPVDFSSTNFKAQMFCLKHQIRRTLVPGLRSLLQG